MKELLIDEKKYDWMIQFIEAAQIPKTHLELMKYMNRKKNEITYFMSEIKRSEIPFSRTRNTHDVWSKYCILITVEEFKKHVEINRKIAKKKDMGTGEDKRKWRGKKGNEILPWYILTTECKIIYFGKSTLQNKKADIE